MKPMVTRQKATISAAPGSVLAGVSGIRSGHAAEFLCKVASDIREAATLA